MARENTVAGLLVAMMLAMMPVWAEEPAKEAGDNSSENGKNEIPICKKKIPIDVGIGPEFIDKNRAGGQNNAGDVTEAEVQDEGRVEMLHKYEVTKRLEYAVTCELERQGYVAAKPIKITGIITDFNLRSTETVIASNISPLIAAVNAGNVDKLVMKVDVLVPGDDKPYQFTSRDSTRKGGFRTTVPSQRLNYMVKNVTKDVIKKFLKAGFIAEPYAISSGSQSLSMGDSIATGNREVLLRITKSLSKQKEPIDTVLLDRVADRIYSSQAESDGGMADTLAHMCKLLDKSKNGKYKQLLLEVSTKAAHSTLRKYAAQAANSLPESNEPMYMAGKSGI